MAILRIFFVAEILEEIALHVPVRNLGGFIRHPVQVLDDIVIMLDAINGGLLFGQLPFYPEIKKRMILAVLLLSRCD
jgi:hypothetical protein